MNSTSAYTILVDGIAVAHYGENEYVDALEDAGSLSYALNSPENNGGVEQDHKIELHYKGKPIQPGKSHEIL